MNLLQKIAVTAEITGTVLSETALKMIEAELLKMPIKQATMALDRVARKCKGKMTLAEIIANVDDGRPSADEAWALVPKSESDTTVWNSEICEAWDCCRELIDGDPVAARMAFKAAYERIVERNRDDRIGVNWWPSLGHDPAGREIAIKKAIELGRLEEKHYLEYLPERLALNYQKTSKDATNLRQLAQGAMKALP